MEKMVHGRLWPDGQEPRSARSGLLRFLDLIREQAPQPD